MNTKTGRIAAVLLLVTMITYVHYRTDHLEITRHIIFRELYFLPIGLAAFWFGTRGAIGASILITLLYLPFVVSLPGGISGHNFGNIVQILLFNLFGLVFGLLRDRDKRRQLELLEAETLAAMGKAVSCIAHDMKTPLIAAGGFVQQVQRKVDDDGLRNKLDLAFGQIHRLEILVGDMLAFARPLNLDYQQGMISRLLEEVRQTASEKAVRHAVTIRTELQDDMPVAEYDKHRLHQALLNLVNNALEASPEGGEVLLTCQADGGKFFIEISDSGNGIPPELRDDIFTPFMTTKKEGTGLGLPIVKKIITAHKGSIAVTENSGKGVTFRVSLPAHP